MYRQKGFRFDSFRVIFFHFYKDCLDKFDLPSTSLLLYGSMVRLYGSIITK